MLSGLKDWLLDHLSWIILPIVGYFVLNLLIWGGKKGVKKFFWRSNAVEDRGIKDWRNILILSLVVVLILIWWLK